MARLPAAGPTCSRPASASSAPRATSSRSPAPSANGQLSQLQFDVRGIEDRDDGIVVSFNARARCHRVVADGEPVSADGVIVYHVNSGRIADAHGVLEWHRPSTIAG